MSYDAGRAAEWKFIDKEQADYMRAMPKVTGFDLTVKEQPGYRIPITTYLEKRKVEDKVYLDKGMKDVANSILSLYDTKTAKAATDLDKIKTELKAKLVAHLKPINKYDPKPGDWGGSCKKEADKPRPTCKPSVESKKACCAGIQIKS